MAKSSRAIGLIATMCLAVSTALPQPVSAGDDTELAQKLWGQAQEMVDESRAINAKIADASNRGDVSAVCSYARQAQVIEKYRFDLSLRMSNLDLDPQNAETVQAALGLSRTALENINDLLSLPECNAPSGPVADPENDKRMNGLNVGVRQAREADVEGNAAYASGQWVTACDRLAAAEQWYAFNSSFALEVSAAFSAKNNPQPQLAGLSTELKGLEKTASSKRIRACRNKKYGVDVSAASIPAKDKAEMTAYDALLEQHNPLADQFYAAKGKGNFDEACPILTKLMGVQKSLIAKSALLLTGYNAEDLRNQNEQISGFLIMSQKLQAEHCA